MTTWAERTRDILATADDVTKTYAPSEQNVREQIFQRLQDALQVNGSFLAVESLTNADVVAQVKALTRQTQALIRLAVGAFDGID